MLAARVLIYGTKDAGRGFWKQLRGDIVATGLKENSVMHALYYFQVDGDIKCMLATHVDDMIWGVKEGFEYLIDELLAKFSLKR